MWGRGGAEYGGRRLERNEGGKEGRKEKEKGIYHKRW